VCVLIASCPKGTDNSASTSACGCNANNFTTAVAGTGVNTPI